MARKSKQVDVLKEIRRALRALRRAEASILYVERQEKKRGEKRMAAEAERQEAGRTAHTVAGFLRHQPMR